MVAFDYFNYVPRESIVYYPSGVTDDAINIEAVVIRESPSLHLGDLVQGIDVFFPRGTAAGQVETLDIGQDEILVKATPYGVQKRCRVIRLLSSDDYVWHVRAGV